MPIVTAPVKGRCARDALTQTFIIAVYRLRENNSTTTKHICNEFDSLIDICDVAFYSNDRRNLL